MVTGYLCLNSQQCNCQQYEKMETEIETIVKSLGEIHTSLNTHRETHLLLAQLITEDTETSEMKKIYHLIEAHCPLFRKKASSLFFKAQLDPTHNIFPMNAEHLKFNCNTNEDIRAKIDDILCKVEIMPSEWTLVQLTSLEVNNAGHKEVSTTSALQITIFECGQNKVPPITMCVDAPSELWGGNIEIIKGIDGTIAENNEGYRKIRDRLKGQIKETYSSFKARLNNDMKQNVKVVQEKWLAEWRVLLMGRFADIAIEREVDERLEELLNEFHIVDITIKRRQLLKYMLKGQAFLDAKETKKILQHCFPDIKKEVVIDIVKIIKTFEKYGKSPRNPIILIVDGTIDQVPWEMLDVLVGQPVSRMQSFDFTYALYQAHESEIVNGRKVIRSETLKGGALMNPSLDLKRMEKRLHSFHSYWIHDWKAMRGKRPTEEEFLDFVSNCDIFSYNGHGDGMQYLRYNHLEKLRINAVVLLFGCKSVALTRSSAIEEPYGSNQQYIMCCCPCIVGYLWNTTDFDSDLLFTNFLSLWVSGPEGKTHWHDIDTKLWAPGDKDIDVDTLPKLSTNKGNHDPDLLAALNKTKRTATNYMTQAGLVARGIPVTLTQ